MARPPEELAAFGAAKFKEKVGRYGNPVTIGTLPDGAGGTVCRAFNRSLKPGDSAFLPQGVSNAAFADVRVYAIAPDALTTAASAGQILLHGSVSYTILAVPPPYEVAGTAIYQNLYAYRTPPSPIGTADAGDEAQRAKWTLPT